MTRLLTLAVITGLSMPLAAQAAQTSQADARPKTGANSATAPAMTDAEFIEKAAAAGMKEVEAGKLASDKATNAEVKTFAQKMVSDHTAAHDELTQFAKTRNVVMKDQATVMKDQATRDQATKDAALVKTATPDLSTLTGVAFDRAYMAQMVKDHQANLTLFETQARDGKDAEVKGWANQKLPVLRGHLKMAQDLHAKIK